MFCSLMNVRFARSFVRPLYLGAPPTNGTALPFSTLDSDDDRGADTERVSLLREDDDESYHARRDGAGQYQGRMPSLETSLKGLNYYSETTSASRIEPMPLE